MWVGQRIWMGSLLMAAGLGVRVLRPSPRADGSGAAVAASGLHPQPVHHRLPRPDLGHRHAVGRARLDDRADRGWPLARVGGATRLPFAVVVALVGGVNATSILLVLLGPGPVAGVRGVGSAREHGPAGRGRRRRASERLSLLVSLWWAAGLWAEGRYGLNVLRVTETVPTVARTSSAAEVLRGLGYWYFYGWDKVQPWTLASVRLHPVAVAARRQLRRSRRSPWRWA